MKLIQTLIFLIFSFSANAYWTADSNNITGGSKDEERSYKNLAMDDSINWTIKLPFKDITLFDLNTYGGWDVGYSYNFLYNFGEGVDVEADGYSNPQLMSVANFSASAKSWLKFQGPGIWMNLWGIDKKSKCSGVSYFACFDVLNALGANVSIDETIELPPIEFKLPFLDDNNPLIRLDFKNGIYNNNYNNTTYLNLIDTAKNIPILKPILTPVSEVVDFNLGFARGIDSYIDIGLDNIEYFNNSNQSIGKQRSANSGVNLNSITGANLNVNKRNYNIGLKPNIGVGMALYTEIDVWGWNIAAYYPLEGSEPPHLIKAEIKPKENILLPSISLNKETNYIVPSANDPVIIDGDNFAKLSVSSPTNGYIDSKEAGIIKCGLGGNNSICDINLKTGKKVALYAYPNYGYKFKSWTGDCKGQQNPCSLSINNSKNISAIFTDNLPPVVNAPMDRVLTANYMTQKLSLKFNSAIANDNADGNITAIPIHSKALWGVGEYQVRYEATDSAGNIGIGIQKITIKAPQDAMLFASETISDNTKFNANEKFTKSWTVVNMGENTWNNSYCLQHYKGYYLGDVNSVCVNGSVSSGQQYTFSVPMSAPSSTSTDKTYVDYWRLTKDGRPFSANVWVKIIVKGLASPQLSIGLQTENSIELNWSKVDGASFYKIYSAEEFSSNNYKEIYSGNNLTFTHNNLQANTNYYYKIQSCISETSCSDFSNVINSYTTKGQGDKTTLIKNSALSNANPKQGESIIISADVFNDGNIAYNDKFRFYITLNDKAIYSSGDDRFYLPEKQSQNFKYQYNILDNATTGNYKLSFCVTYFQSINNQDFYCKDSQITINELPVSIPNNVDKLNISFYESANNGDRLFISWSDITNFYRLFRADSINGNYSQIYSGINSGYNDKNITTDSRYFYKLKSCQTSSQSTCSNFSNAFNGVASSNYEIDAEDDFYVTWSSLINNTADVTHRYQGTREKLADDVKVGIYLSNDTTCTTNDDFLGDATSELGKNDVFDSEQININIPSKAQSGTWYLCAIADYDNKYIETDETNNTSYIILEDGSEDTLDPNAPDVKLSLSYDDKRDTFGISWKTRLLTGDFKLSYSFNGSSYTKIDYIDGTKGTNQGILTQQIASSTDNNKIYFKVEFTGLDPDVGGYPNYYKVFGPLSYTPTQVDNTPKTEVISDAIIKVTWDSALCSTSHYAITRNGDVESDKFVYLDTRDSFIDYFVKPNTEYSYALHCSDGPDDYYRNDFSYSTAYSTPVTTLESHSLDNNWQKLNTNLPTELQGRSGYKIVNFQNKLWIIGGVKDNVNMQDVYSSVDGISWVKEVDDIGFITGTSYKIIEHNDKLFIMRGYNYSYDVDGKYIGYSIIKEVWSSTDGKNWIKESDNFPTKETNSASNLISFQDKLWLFGGRNSVGVWSSSDNGKTWQAKSYTAPLGDDFFQHRTFILNNKLFLIGGQFSVTCGYCPDQEISRDIWSSTDGITWNKAKEKVVFGSRYNPSIVKFNDYIYLIGGNKELPDYWYESKSAKTTNQHTNYNYTMDIWRSKNGLDWENVTYDSGLPDSLTTENSILFNNKIHLIYSNGDIYTTDYGYASPLPETKPIVNTNDIKQQVLSVDLTNFTDERGINNLTYQWYNNDEVITNATSASLTITGFATGSKIKVAITYNNDNNYVHTVFSDALALELNSDYINFANKELITNFTTTALVQNLEGVVNDDIVEFSSNNSQIATVSGNNASATITILGVGTTTINAKITRTDGQIINASMNLSIYKAQPIFGFANQTAYYDLVDGNTITFTLNNQQNHNIIYTSSNENIAIVNSSGLVKFYQTGKVKITASFVGDNYYLPASDEITIMVNDTDYDNDSIADSVDNCPYTYNPNQEDTDNDGIGDACDTTDIKYSLKIDLNPYADIYINGIKCSENCINSYNKNSNQQLSFIITNTNYQFVNWSGNCSGNDNYFIINMSDNKTCSINLKLVDTDNDGIPDIKDSDDDNDGISDTRELELDLNPLVSNLFDLNIKKGVNFISANINTNTLNNDAIDIVWSINNTYPYFLGYSSKDGINDKIKRRLQDKLLVQTFDNEATFIFANKDTTLEVLDTAIANGGYNAVARINYKPSNYPQGVSYHGANDYLNISDMKCVDNTSVDMVMKIKDNKQVIWHSTQKNFTQIEPNEGYVVFCK